MEHEAVFILVDCGHDEYPGDGLRLKPVASPDFDPKRGSYMDTGVLYALGFNYDEFKEGDEIRISAKILSRVVTERRPVE